VPEYRYIGVHADQLASGRHIAPGDKVPGSAVDENDPLLDEGLLIEIPAAKKKESQ
jgi:hypothetical protein